MGWNEPVPNEPLETGGATLMSRTARAHDVKKPLG